MDHPIDRAGVLTEQRNPRSGELDRLSTRDLVELINAEDRTVARRVADALGDVTRFADIAADALAAGGRLIYLGAGTSGRLGVLDASECPPTFRSEPGRVVGIIAGGDPALRVSSEGREDERDGARTEFDALGVGPNDAVLGISAGGTTPFALGGVELAKARGARTGLLVCDRIDKPAWCDVLICVLTGPEVVTGSTRMKAGTATKMVLNSISTASMVSLGKTYSNLMVDVRATNDKLRDRAARLISEVTGLDRPASFELLNSAGDHVKTAIVMHRRGVSREDAELRLRAVNGRLRDALESG